MSSLIILHVLCIILSWALFPCLIIPRSVISEQASSDALDAKARSILNVTYIAFKNCDIAVPSKA